MNVLFPFSKALPAYLVIFIWNNTKRYRLEWEWNVWRQWLKKSLSLFMQRTQYITYGQLRG